MPYRISDFYNALDMLAPFDSAQDWDNVGLLAGSHETEVKAALLALDVTSDVLDEAAELGANLIITHHPVIFPYIKRISGQSLLYRLIQSGISVISAHTNLDISPLGVNAALCERLGLDNIRALESGGQPVIGCIGELHKIVESHELAAFVRERLGVPSVKYTRGGTVTTVAVCGGSGSDMFECAISNGAQALVTSEVKHHVLLGADEAGFTIIDAGHYATEAVVIPHLADLLRERLPGAVITVSTSQRDPAFYIVS